MKWTTKTPTVAGWYWWRKRAGKVPSVVELAEAERDEPDDGRLVRQDVDEYVPNPGTYGGGEWAGPLVPPED